MDMTPSLPLTEATETVDGVELYYRMGGSGPPLVLLHGFTLVGQQWDPFLDELGKDYTVIVPDLPGMGRSGRPKGDFTHREAGRLTFRLMDALGIDRLRGIGHSSGGIMLLHMALQQPGRMEAIVPVAGHIGCRSRSVKSAGPEREAWKGSMPTGWPSLGACIPAASRRFVGFWGSSIALGTNTATLTFPPNT